MAEVLSTIKSDRFRKITSGSASRFGAYVMGKRYVSGEYNLFEYGRILDTEAIAAKAIGRKVAVTFRNGWTIKSENQKFLKRIKQRIRELEFVTDTTFSELLDQIVRTLYLYNNCYVLITRSDKSSTSKGNKKKPIAGLSVIPVETIDVLLDPDGNILGYKQRVGAYKKEYGKDELVHLHLDKRPGMILGTPPLEYVKDDIIALRKIEENVELLIDRSIFPLLHAKVGTADNPATLLQDGTTEVDQIAWKMETVDKTGGLVTNERVEIKAIGAESLALRVESYLSYFKSRVLIGLGVSEIDLGEGNSTGRSTGEVLSLNIIDTVEQYQKVVEEFFKVMFREMLLDDKLIKNTYSVEEEDLVLLDFHPTSQDKEIKMGAHYSDMYAKGVVDLNEARSKIGKKELNKDQEKNMFHERTKQKDEGSKALSNTAQPKNQHTSPKAKVKPKIKTKSGLEFDIPKSLITDETINYARSKLVSRIESLDLGVDDEGIVTITNNVIDRLLSNITLSQQEVIREEITRYIME